MNGKTKRVEKTSKRLKRTVEENNMFASLLETSEIETAIRELKNKKAAGVDERSKLNILAHKLSDGLLNSSTTAYASKKYQNHGDKRT